MSNSYITLSQAQQALPAGYTVNSAVLQQVCYACSDFLDKYCNRANQGFNVQTYDILLNGTGTNIIYLPNLPVQNIAKLATVETPCLAIHNTNNDMGVRATAAIVGTPLNNENLSSQYQSTGMLLTLVQSAVTTTNTLTWVSYPTIAQLANAVNALGNGWTANIMGGFGTWSSSDLRATMGAFGSRIITSFFQIHWVESWGYRINEENGEIRNNSVFDFGTMNWRCIYTAGYQTFPDDLSWALCELVKLTYLATNVDPNLQSESMENYSYTRAMPVAGMAFSQLSEMARRTINLYKIRSVGSFSNI